MVRVAGMPCTAAKAENRGNHQNRDTRRKHVYLRDLMLRGGGACIALGLLYGFDTAALMPGLTDKRIYKQLTFRLIPII